MDRLLNPTRSAEGYRTGYLRLKSVLYDRATDLPSFPVLFDHLRNALEQRKALGLLHLEIVNLDVVESLYGWQVFDQVLGRASDVLRDCIGDPLPDNTLLAVNGVAGDRFVAFVLERPDGKEVDPPFLNRLGATLCERLAAGFDIEEFAGLSPELLFRAGQSRISIDPFYRFERRIYSALAEAAHFDDDREHRRELSWAEELKRIIRRADVDTVFQPVVDLRSREVLGHEAFVRGPKDSMFEAPRAMFTLGSRVGVAAELDRLCRRCAVRSSAGVAGRGKLFLNVYPGDGGQTEQAAEEVLELIRGTSFDPVDVVLELSEREGSLDTDAFVGRMLSFRKRGFGIAVDDVGTGRSSREIVERGRPDYVKLDVSLVRGIHSNLIQQEVLNSLIRIARKQGAAVIAEGVEHRREVDALIEAGTQYGQGYFFAPPGPSPVGRR